jgi:hypothetical protein
VLALGLKILLGKAEKTPQIQHPLAASRQKISDWLKFNGLSHETVLMQLSGIGPSKESGKHQGLRSQSCLGLAPEDAWALCAHSMRRACPVLAPVIDIIEADTPKCLRPKKKKHPQPFTYDLGFETLPFVSVHYQDRAADLLAMAHEFGHAVQIVSSWVNGEGQMPPIARECCAFIAEQAMVQFCEAQFEGLKSAYYADDKIYLGSNKASLEDALRNDAQPYQYIWNYPLARILAAQLFQTADNIELWKIFQGEWSLSDCVNAVKVPNKVNSMKNYFPEVPERNAERPAIEAYRGLGMMAYLDLDYWLGQSEKTIEEYYGALLKHMQNQTSYVVIGPENKPIGYATWNVDDSDPDSIEITRQAAPFGDHLHVQRSLQKRLPNAKSATSINERSARVEQIAW